MNILCFPYSKLHICIFSQHHAEQLRRNTNILKRRLRQIIENQLEVINEIDNVDFEKVDNNY